MQVDSPLNYPGLQKSVCRDVQDIRHLVNCPVDIQREFGYIRSFYDQTMGVQLQSFVLRQAVCRPDPGSKHNPTWAIISKSVDPAGHRVHDMNVGQWADGGL